MDREAWQAIVLGITKSWIQLSTHIIFHTILIEILCGSEHSGLISFRMDAASQSAVLPRGTRLPMVTRINRDGGP